VEPALAPTPDTHESWNRSRSGGGARKEPGKDTKRGAPCLRGGPREDVAEDVLHKIFLNFLGGGRAEGMAEEDMGAGWRAAAEGR